VVHVRLPFAASTRVDPGPELPLMLAESAPRTLLVTRGAGVGLPVRYAGQPVAAAQCRLPRGPVGGAAGLLGGL